MSDGFLPVRPPPGGHEPDGIELVRPEGRAEAVARWRVRAAEWRAAEVAEAVFGGRVVPRLTGLGGTDFRGLLELEVPFRDLAGHRTAESRFLAEAARDPLLSAMPMVVTFAPRQRRPRP